MSPLEVAIAIRELGLDIVIEEEPAWDGFVPGVWLENAKVHVCHWAAHSGDVLHEAAHMALIPSRFRRFVTRGDVEGPALLSAIKAYTVSQECFDSGPDHWLMRALIQMSDTEAQAWSYAAASYIGFPTRDAFCFEYPGVPVDRQPYGGYGEDVWLGLRAGCHPGIHGMQAAGMTRVRDWPNMIRWVQL